MYRETNALFHITPEQRKALYGVFVMGIRPPRVLIGTPYVTSLTGNGDPVLSPQALRDFEALIQSGRVINSQTGDIETRDEPAEKVIDVIASPFTFEQEARIREIIAEALAKLTEALRYESRPHS